VTDGAEFGSLGRQLAVRMAGDADDHAAVQRLRWRVFADERLRLVSRRRSGRQAVNS
jgi:hypothetical protein